MKKTETDETLQRQAIDWLLTLDRADCTAAQREAFQAWLAQGEDRQQIYWQASKSWESMSRFKDRDFPVRRQALRARAAKPPLLKFSAWAAAVAILLCLGYATFSNQGWQGAQSSYATARGGRQTVQLADGSSVELNTDSEIAAHFDDRQRSVELIRGEAYFTVAHDATRPFAISAGKGRITDIGTRFDVRLGGGQVEVAVDEGSVRIDADGQQTLQAGQMAAYDPQGRFQPIDADSVEQLTAWRRGQLVFLNRRLDRVLLELQRYHDVRLSLSSPELAQLKVSGAFHTDNLDNALNIIGMTLPVKIRRAGPGQVVLDKR